MDKIEKKSSKKIEDLDVSGVVQLLDKHQMTEFKEFCEERQVDGRKLMNVTEGIVKLWRPKINANKLIIFIEELKLNPEKFLGDPRKGADENKLEKVNSVELINHKVGNKEIIEDNTILITETVEQDVVIKVSVDEKIIESQYQTVKKTKENNLSHFNNVEEIIKRIVPAKSFLYRNQGKKDTPAYLPMEAGSPKRKRLFRLSGYDYPIFDWKRFSKPDMGDRGYYPMKRNSRFFIQKTKSPESKRKYKSISTTDELKYPEDHFYEDLCYAEIDKARSSVSSGQNVKPYRVKIQELFQSFKLPFFRRTEEVVDEVKKEDDIKIEEEKRVAVEREPIYENTDSMSDMYDSVHVNNQVGNSKENASKLPVEDYLEPVQVSREYCDVSRQRDDSLLGYIMSIFENRFGIWRETNETHDDSDTDSHKTVDDTDAKKWTEEQKPKNMADRPLPMPVENEPYYMNIDRTEAENLLKGQPNGTFILRPSSQPNHAYTLSVACNKCVHNVGIRRRADGRIALGFARRGERTFTDMTSLLRHHRKRRLLLVTNGGVIGATTLNDSPQYYQSPCNLPVPKI